MECYQSRVASLFLCLTLYCLCKEAFRWKKWGFGTVFVMALDFVFPALRYVEKVNFHVNHEEIDSK